MLLKGRKMREAFSTLGAVIRFNSHRNGFVQIKVGNVNEGFGMLISIITLTEPVHHVIAVKSENRFINSMFLCDFLLTISKYITTFLTMFQYMGAFPTRSKQFGS